LTFNRRRGHRAQTDRDQGSAVAAATLWRRAGSVFYSPLATACCLLAIGYSLTPALPTITPASSILFSDNPQTTPKDLKAESRNPGAVNQDANPPPPLPRGNQEINSLSFPQLLNKSDICQNVTAMKLLHWCSVSDALNPFLRHKWAETRELSTDSESLKLSSQ
jgi:hypothetical protein